MKFRTLLTDPTAPGPKPTQAFHPTQTQAREWAVTILKGASEQAYVTLYAEVEVEVYQWKQTLKPKLTPEIVES